MNLKETLEIVIDRLRSGQLDNEAQVKQAVILPVLRALGWDDTDPQAFKPEYSVGHGFVDYALLDHRKPLIFIEAKRVGSMDTGGEQQLFGYASNRGVPFLILTDGDRWDFYLSMAAGEPAERRFYRLELQLEHKISEYVEFLGEHLRKDLVISGKARLNAEQRHASNQERERARSEIPSAWYALLSEPDETLRDLLAEKVESECGTKPELDDVDAFLKDRSRSSSLPAAPSQPPSPTPKGPVPHPAPSAPERSRIVGFVCLGEHIETKTAIGALIEVLKIFERKDSQFMEHFAARTVSRNRQLVARNRTHLYEQSHLVDKHSKKLWGDWWLGTNLSKNQIRGHIRTACEVAGVEFGTQLKLIER